MELIPQAIGKSETIKLLILTICKKYVTNFIAPPHFENVNKWGARQLTGDEQKNKQSSDSPKKSKQSKTFYLSNKLKFKQRSLLECFKMSNKCFLTCTNLHLTVLLFEMRRFSPILGDSSVFTMWSESS